MRILSGKYIKSNKVLENTSKDIKCFATDSYIISVFGKITVDNNEVQDDEIFDIWKSNGDDFVNHVEGLYIIALYDKNTKDFCIYQDRSSSPVALYYTETDDSLFYSTSLLDLLKSSGIERKLNKAMLGDFLTNGYIVGEGTLAENVYKLKFFSCLKIENSKAIQKKVEYKIKDISIPEAASEWTDALDNSIKRCVSGDKIYSPLSSGYDSNYIVYIENRDFDKPVECFSIGGKTGKSELPIVKENAKIYPKVELKYALTDKNSLKDFPDIVFRLEGSIFECGLFLQYSLAKLLNENNVPYIICGECADQVMNNNYYNEDRMCDDYGEKNKYYDFAEYPMAYGHYVILKKSGIMMNSFGIEGKYPFLDKSILPIAKSLSCINKRDKRFHVAMCEKHLDSRIIDNISKIGGSTDAHSLFEDKQSMKDFIKVIKNSDLYKEFGKTASLGGMFASADKKISAKERLRRIVYAIMGKKIEKDYFWEEIALRELLCYAYVMLFDKLILSEKYDNSVSIEESFYDIINN